MKEKWEPKKWRKWYDSVLDWVLQGENYEEIAKKLERSAVGIRKLVLSEMFQKKLSEIHKATQEVRKEEAVSLQQRMEEEKKRIFEKALHLIDHAQSESVRARLITWFLEKFPEFAPKESVGVKQETHIHQASPEQLLRQEKAAKELLSVMEQLTEGNPFVEKEEDVTDDLQDNRTGENPIDFSGLGEASQ